MTSNGIDVDRFAAHVFRRNGDLDGDLRRRADRVESVARKLAPVRTGLVRRSITVSRNRDAGRFAAGYAISARAPYLSHIIYGTRPHRITAHRPPWVLWSEIDGFLGVSVMHPGTRPNPFMSEALELGAGR